MRGKWECVFVKNRKLRLKLSKDGETESIDLEKNYKHIVMVGYCAGLIHKPSNYGSESFQKDEVVVENRESKLSYLTGRCGARLAGARHFILAPVAATFIVAR